jgi:AraC-like DNA-binding protein
MMIKTKLNNLLILTMLLPTLAMASPDTTTTVKCPEVRIEVEQLPDLNIPRAGHEVFCVNGELTVAGGHTNGFVPTPTAEYLKDGEWNVMTMTYPHDNGFSVVLSSGQVMLGGGSEEPLGIGQTFMTETYDPLTHTFNGYCSLQRKRACASALELDSGRVVVAGNWYANDGIELFEDKSDTRADYNGKRLFTYIKDVWVQRAYPMIFRMANDDALIFGGVGVKGDSLWSTTAYNLKGDSVTIPLLEDWWPLSTEMSRPSESFMGDEAKKLYAYLMAVENRKGQVAIAKVVNGETSLLPTDCLVPMQSHGEEIIYSSTILVDQKAGRGYLVGLGRSYYDAPDKPGRWYVLSIDYTKQPASLTLCYTDALSELNTYAPTLTPEGNLLVAGGLHNGSNFTPSKHVILLRVGREPAAAEIGNDLWQTVLLVLAGLVLIGLLAYLFIYIRKRRRNQKARTLDSLGAASGQESVSLIPDSEASADLMERIYQVMEAQKLYQDSNLKVTDLAAALGTNRRSVSDCINSQKGCTFTQFVNIYRVEHAKRVMRQNPGKKVTDIYLESGFANEGSFFRTFKAITGMTPKEWLSKS